MVAPPSNPHTLSNLLSTQSSLIQTLCSFLTVGVHHLLYLRSVYPRVSFLSTRAYNFPVRQNRHPAVCAWINSAIDAVRDQLEKNTVKRVILYIYEVDRNVVLEKWTFDLRAFPVVERADADTPFEKQAEGGDVGPSGHAPIGDQAKVASLEAQFRATLSRLSSASARLDSVPKDIEISFTLGIEVRDGADRPVGRLEKEERKWIVTEPEPWSDAEEGGMADVKGRTNRPSRHSGQTNRTLSVRRLDAGELRMEIWVEESKAKSIQATRAAAKE